jgi:RNA polymerase sigma-70 factor (ECF subfamily)
MIGTSLSLFDFTFAPMGRGVTLLRDDVLPASMLSEDPESSVALLRRARGGDHDALNDLCARYLPRLERWARGRLPGWARSAVDTQDLVQLTIAQVAQHVASFEPRHEGAFQAYVRRALLNQIRDEIRRAQRNAPGDPLASDRPSSDPSPLERAVGQELLERYDAALERLKDSDREAIVARVEMGLNWSEVADALGKNSAEAAQMTVSRALVRLAREMSHDRRA